MPEALQTLGQQHDAGKFQTRAANLLSQQIWCWGSDVLRSEGNWLLEIGFQRIEAPADRENCSSVYLLPLPVNRRVVLRGFGVFYGDDQRGGVFLRRYEFEPQYTRLATLECPPWSVTDLPRFSDPNDSQLNDCAVLTFELIDWIRRYEENLVEQLGIEYRQSTLLQMDKNKRAIIPAEEMVTAWGELSNIAATNVDACSKNQQ